MKRFPKSILRACCAIAAGAILVQYRDQAVMWITVGIGVVFFISAVISFIATLKGARWVSGVRDVFPLSQ